MSRARARSRRWSTRSSSAIGRLDALVCRAAVETRASVDRLRRRAVAAGHRREPQGSVPVHEARNPRHRRRRRGTVVLLGRCSARWARPDTPPIARRKVRSSTSRSRPRSSTRPTASASTWSRRRRPTRDSSRGVARHRRPRRRAADGRSGNTRWAGSDRAEEVSATVAFLCSPAAAFISGAVIPLDGAWPPGRT